MRLDLRRHRTIGQASGQQYQLPLEAQAFHVSGDQPFQLVREYRIQFLLLVIGKLPGSSLHDKIFRIGVTNCVTPVRRIFGMRLSGWLLRRFPQECRNIINIGAALTQVVERWKSPPNPARRHGVCRVRLWGPGPINTAGYNDNA